MFYITCENDVKIFNFRLLAKIANLLKPNGSLLRIDCYQNFIFRKNKKEIN